MLNNQLPVEAGRSNERLAKQNLTNPVANTDGGAVSTEDTTHNPLSGSDREQQKWRETQGWLDLLQSLATLALQNARDWLVCI